MRLLSFLALLCPFACAAVLAPAAAAQYFGFGKNRVQYDQHDWHFLQSRHFDVYYYEPGGQYLAEVAADAAEEAYAQVRTLFGAEIAHRIPLLVYQSHNDFAVTNAVELPVYAEGIGGVTELFQNRIAVPFTGDWRDFRRVVHHELVHAVLNDLFYGGSVRAALRQGRTVPIPLWFNEGLAEYAAQGWDTQSDMYLREAVLTGRLAEIERLRGYFAYRGGQGVWDFVAEQYGRQKVAEIIERLQATRSARAAFKGATGLDLDALSDEWHAALQAVYFPEAAARERMEAVGRRLLDDDAGGRYTTSPAISPFGDRVAFLTATDGLFDVYVAETTGDAPPRRLIDGQTSPAFESLRILTPGLSWGPEGNRLAVAVKSGPTDAVAIVDVQTGDAVRYRVPGVDAIVSVAFAPDGRRVAFEGTDGPQSDVYVLDLETAAVTNYTDDAFSDHEPAWSPDGRSLVFHSDRGDHRLLRTYRAALPADSLRGAPYDVLHDGTAPYALYRLRLDRPDMLDRLTPPGAWDATSAAFGDDPDHVLFLSDRNGIPNLYAHHLPTGRERPLTDLAVGATQLSVSADGSRAAVTALHDGAPTIFLITHPLARDVGPGPLQPTVWAQRVEGERGGTSPAVLLAEASASRAALEANPFVRDAADGRPYDADPSRRLDVHPRRRTARRAPPPELLAVLDSLARAPRPPAVPDTTADGALVFDARTYRFSAAFDEAAEEARADRLGPLDPFAGTPPERPDGTYPEQDYLLDFSLDLAYGTVGYTTLFGVQSVTQLYFSDVLGDHRLYVGSNLLLDLRNSDYALGYAYRGGRTDLGVEGFHLAREVPDFASRRVYRYRNWGLSASASHPLSKFTRVDVGVSGLGVQLTDLTDLGAPSRTRYFLYPSLAYTRDTTVPGFLAPLSGRRWAVGLAGSPGLSVLFGTALADARQYLHLGYGYTVALRLSGGLSVGPDPQRFYAAGVQNWINPSFQTLPVEDENDFLFGTPVLPLRGYGFNEGSAPTAGSGDRFALLNAEVRMPLFAAILPGPIPVLPLYNVEAVGFVDAGAIWTGGLRLTRETSEGRRLDEALLGMGVGLRTILLGVPLRADWGWPYDYDGFGEGRFYLSVGLDY